jgi:hypothetical protein
VNKIIPVLLLLTFIVHGQKSDLIDASSEVSPISMYLKAYGKCCCSKDAVGDKNCENILWQAQRGRVEPEEFQKLVIKEDGIKLLCAIINTRFACGSCGGPTCPGEEKSCSIGANYETTLDDLDDLE